MAGVLLRLPGKMLRIEVAIGLPNRKHQPQQLRHAIAEGHVAAEGQFAIRPASDSSAVGRASAQPG